MESAVQDGLGKDPVLWVRGLKIGRDAYEGDVIELTLPQLDQLRGLLLQARPFLAKAVQARINELQNALGIQKEK